MADKSKKSKWAPHVKKILTADDIKEAKKEWKGLNIEVDYVEDLRGRGGCLFSDSRKWNYVEYKISRQVEKLLAERKAKFREKGLLEEEPAEEDKAAEYEDNGSQEAKSVSIRKGEVRN